MTNKLWRALRCWQPVLACRVKSSLSSSSALEAVLDFLAAAAGGGTLSEEQNGGQNEQQGGAKTRLLSNKCKPTSLLSFFGSVLHIGAVGLLRFAVPAWTCADTDLEAPAAQDHAPVDTERRSKVAQWLPMDDIMVTAVLTLESPGSGWWGWAGGSCPPCRNYCT